VAADAAALAVEQRKPRCAAATSLGGRRRSKRSNGASGKNQVRAKLAMAAEIVMFGGGLGF